MYHKIGLFTAGLLVSTAMHAGTINGNAVVGSMLGAAAGSAIGSASGGKEGAILGGGIGGAIGAAVSGRSTSASGTMMVGNGYRDHGRHPGKYRYRNGNGYSY